VFVGVAGVPLALEISWRAGSSPGLHAQSEVIVTEEAARATLHGHDPYATDYSDTPLRDRPLGTRTHFPYLPAMLLFGIPRALDGTGGWSDARAWFTIMTLGVTGLALWLWKAPSPLGRLRLAQVLLVLPTSALLMATGGDDLPVVALMLLAVVLMSRGDDVAGAAVAGLAAAMKQTAWLFVPLLLMAVAAASHDVARRRTVAVRAALTTAVVGVIVVPFAAWSPAAFAEDVVKFPLGLGQQRSAAGTVTVGSILVRAFPSARTAITWLIVGTLVALAVVLLRRARHASPPRAAGIAGLLFVAAIALAPAGRVAYLVYPLNLLVWSWLLGRERPGAAAIG
jgi:hypothetical protein